MLNNGLIDLNGQSLTTGSLDGNGTYDNVSAGGSVTLQVGVDNNNSTFAGVILNTTATAGLTKVGTGVLVLTGTNTYTGPTTIDVGGLRLTSSHTLSTLSEIEVESGGLGKSVSSGALILSNGVTIQNPILVDIATASEFVDLPDANETATIAGPITLSPVGNIQLRPGFTNASATLTLTGASTAGTDDVVFTEGNIVFAGSGSLTCDEPVNGGLFFGRGSTTTPFTLLLENDSSVTNSGLNVRNIGGNITTGRRDGYSAESGGAERRVGQFRAGFQHDGQPGLDAQSQWRHGHGGVVFRWPSSGSAATSSLIINFNGGTIVAASSSQNFLPVSAPSPGDAFNVQNGGIIIDTNGFNDIVNTPTKFTSEPLPATLDGGLTKTGPGELVFGSTADYVRHKQLHRANQCQRRLGRLCHRPDVWEQRVYSDPARRRRGDRKRFALGYSIH